MEGSLDARARRLENGLCCLTEDAAVQLHWGRCSFFAGSYQRCSVPLKEFIVSEINLKRVGSPYQSYSMHHACDVCEEICNRMIYFSYYCKYGVLVFGDDWTGPADESKRTKRVQGWSRQIMGWNLHNIPFIICNTITL